MSEKEKTSGELLAEKLLYKPKTAAETLKAAEIPALEAFCADYLRFIDAARTEREAVAFLLPILRDAGFAPLEPGRCYAAGERVYRVVGERALLFATVGTLPLEAGVNIAASHVDSPRLDLKPNPLYEDTGLALFKTHYYGGIKKYQWTAVPLSLRGVIVKKSGETVTVQLGCTPGDPVFCVNDLLPHLAKDQMAKTLKEGVKGEDLNVLVGGLPFADDKVSEKVKLAVLKLFFERYGVTEEDFLSAELCMVPAYPACEVGLDRAFLGAYGHDDRVCAYTSMRAALENVAPERTSVCILADKEETGSDGLSGLKSRMLADFIDDLGEGAGVPGRRILAASSCLSADVNAAYDPTYPEVLEKQNASYAGRGIVVTKYTGSGGKYDTNDCGAEFMAKVRALFDEAGVLWQLGELGKVDQGGGGTVAKFISRLGVRTVDVGVPVLSMHAPFEVVAKSDVYYAYRAFAAFFAKA